MSLTVRPTAIADVVLLIPRRFGDSRGWFAETYSTRAFGPRGFAHGYCTLEPDTEVAYKVDAFYAPACDGGLRWDHPTIGIAWPIALGEAVLSDKDKGEATLC